MRVTFSIILTALIPTMVLAQMAGMTEEQMQQMMQNVQKMQACFSKIDQTQIQTLASKGKSMEADIKSMCTNGKRDQAQQLAITFAEDYLESDQIKALRKCGENIAEFLPDMPSMVEQANKNNTHVCDAY